jgi:hypothetical protein
MTLPNRFFSPFISRLTAVTSLVFLSCSVASAQEKPMFNGTDLTGWLQVGSSWSVKDGAINCQPTDEGTFLVWKGGELADFQFGCKFRFREGLDKKWWFSGIRFRNRITNPERLDMTGYCYDMNLNFGRTGNFLEAGPRSVLATRGERSFMVNSGDLLHPTALFSTIALPDAEKAHAAYKPLDWNDLKIVALGRRILFFLNGFQIVDAIDESSGPVLSGTFALVKGPIDFKDLTLRDLKGVAATSPASGLPPEAPKKWSSVQCQYLKAKSASPKPKGTRTDRNPVMDSDDANGVTESKPIYFDLHTGTEIHYDVSSDAPLTELSYTGVAFNNFHIEIRDPKGAVVTNCGPYEGGNMTRVIRMPLPNLLHFEVVLKTNSSDWLLVEDLHFSSAPQGSVPALASRTLAQNPAATPRSAAPVVPQVTPLPPPPVAVAPPPLPPIPPSSGSERPAAPTTPSEPHARTACGGGQSGKDFAETQPEGGVLVGLEVWKGEYFRALVIAGIRGIYRTDKGRVRGQIFGRGNGDPDATLVANNGDSPIIRVDLVDDREQVIAMRVAFSNNQESPWIGRDVPKNLPANKMPKNLRTFHLNGPSWKGALGIYGGADGVLFRFGLIY